MTWFVGLHKNERLYNSLNAHSQQLIATIITTSLHFSHPACFKKKPLTVYVMMSRFFSFYHLDLGGGAGDTQIVYAPCGDL